MITNSITHIAHGILNDSINILYNNHNSLFDNLFKDLDYNIYGYNDHIYAYYYDLCISNSFLNYNTVVGAFANKLHIKSCLFFHDVPPPAFKKEDIALAQQNVNKVHKIIFGSDLANSWKMIPDKYTTVIEYGLPTFDSSHTDRTKCIIILNLENNQNISMLYQHIKSHIDDCYMLNTIPLTWTIADIYSILSQYKICINLSHTINTLIAAGSGCQTITSQQIPRSIDKNKLISYVTDYTNIVSMLQVLLNMNLSNDEREYNQQKLITLFNYDTFRNKLSNTIQNLKTQEIFVYE